MTIYLEAPTHRAGGPDGKGWNRLSLNAHMGAPSGQCALRPTDYPTFVESWRGSRHARWGSYGPCVRDNDRRDCFTCPVLTNPPRPLDGDRRLVHICEQTSRDGNRARTVLLIGHSLWSWGELSRIQGWTAGRLLRRGRRQGFWLTRIPNTPNGTS